MSRRISRYPPIGVDGDGGERWGKKGTRCRPFEEMTCLVCLYHAPRERFLKRSCSQGEPYSDDAVSLDLGTSASDEEIVPPSLAISWASLLDPARLGKDCEACESLLTRTSPYSLLQPLARWESGQDR